MTVGQRWMGHFFADPDFDEEARLALGQAPLGARGIGLTLGTFESIVDGDADSWFRSWLRVARQLQDQASSILAVGHFATAAAFFIGASDAYSRSIVFADRMIDASDHGQVLANRRCCWEAFIDASGARFQRLPVPLGTTTLSAYLLRPELDVRPRPTLVVIGGPGGATSQYAFGARAAVGWGWNAVVFDGPDVSAEPAAPSAAGPDKGAVLTPIINALLRVADVDGSALFVYGVGLGGYWLPRALAFEHRFAAAVADPGIMDISTAWTDGLPSELAVLLQPGNAVAFDEALEEAASGDGAAGSFARLSRIPGLPLNFESISLAGRCHFRVAAEQIRTPMMITKAENERHWPGQSEELQQHVQAQRELAVYTSAMGADGHCEPLARNMVELRMLDFFRSHLRGVSSAKAGRPD